MKLTYWKAELLTDGDCYSIREKTRKAVLAELAAAYRPQDFTAPFKVEIEYDDAFDLMAQATGEGGLYEPRPQGLQPFLQAHPSPGS